MESRDEGGHMGSFLVRTAVLSVVYDPLDLLVHCLYLDEVRALGFFLLLDLLENGCGKLQLATTFKRRSCRGRIAQIKG